MIKKGVGVIIGKTQEIKLPNYQEKVNGWELPMTHFTLKNSKFDVMTVNYPDSLMNYEEHQSNQSPPCGNWIYAAYLQPGQLHFLLYVPERRISIPKDLHGFPAPSGGLNEFIIPERLYCKEILVNLRAKEIEPFIPKLLRGKTIKQAISDVWRLWKYDTTSQ